MRTVMVLEYLGELIRLTRFRLKILRAMTGSYPR